MILQTERLILREFTLDDAKDLYLLNNDPDVIRYTGDEAFESIDAAADFVRHYDHYQKYGFGRWAVIEKDTGAFLGWCGLKYTHTSNEYDIGFRFFKKFWNKGYATESAAACINFGFQKLGLSQIIGRAALANTASINVLQKLGLTFVRNMDCHHDLGAIYIIKNTMSNIPFQITEWSQIEKTEHQGETGVAFWQTVQHEGLRIRTVEYSAGYFADHWCQKGHIVYCLEGEFVNELETGKKTTLTKGMSYIVSDALSSHRSFTENGVKLLIIDGDFLK